jgi:hypothetical protein
MNIGVDIMNQRFVAMLSGVCAIAFSANLHAADQTLPGAGNDEASRLVARSLRVIEAHRFLVQQAQQIKSASLRRATLDLLQNPNFCVTARARLSGADKARILSELTAAGLVEPADEAGFPGGLKTGVFPPVLNDGSACPRMPMAFDAAPGSSFTSHHGYPGGLPIHEANNERAALGLANGYRVSYGDGHSGHADGEDDRSWFNSPFFIDQDVIIAAPIWHDWAKTIVFQWTADGQSFKELNFGGNAGNGTATGGHHIISISESIKRGLPAAFVIAQASAHSNPTSGNESKVVNWLRAASILAQVDPVAAGYLSKDAAGGWHLPALRKLGDGVDLAASGQTNLLPEYTLHNLSDGDFTYSIPAAGDAALLIAQLAPRFGFDPQDTARYNTKYRNPVFANLSQERLVILYANGGLSAVQKELQALRLRGIF